MTTVLLVEDSATLRHLLTEAFQRQGLVVHTVEDPSEVLAAAQRLQPSVIVLNKMLPGREGLSLIPELRADATLGEFGIMMLTDAKRQQDVVQSIEGGADDYVIKPFDPAEVASRVERLAATVAR